MEVEPPSCMFFQKLIKFGAFQGKMNITKLSPIFQSKNWSTLSKYRPISAFLCFSKLHERAMCNGLSNSLTEN